MYQITQATLEIERYLSAKQPGDLISFDEVQEKTKVTMDNRGKAYLRTALKRLELEYLPHQGKGVELADEHTALVVINGRVKKINSSVRRGSKTHKVLVNRHYSKLSVEDQKRADFIGAVFAVMYTESKGLAGMMRKVQLTESKPDIKDYN